jgi:hypothetical protein
MLIKLRELRLSGTCNIHGRDKKFIYNSNLEARREESIAKM